MIVRQGPDHGGIWRISRRVAPGDEVNHRTSGVAGKISADNVDNHVVNVVSRVVNRGANETPIVEAVFDALRDDPKLSATRMASMLGVASRTVQRALKTLQETGRIRRIGGTRGKWDVIV